MNYVSIVAYKGTQIKATFCTQLSVCQQTNINELALRLASPQCLRLRQYLLALS